MARSAFTPIEFLIPEGMEPETLKSRLAGDHRFSEEPEHLVGRSYYDSFDWRLYDAAGLLEVEPEERGLRLRWRSLEDSGVIGELRLDVPPRWVEDLPPGPFREHLTPLLEMRALLPVARVESRVQILRLLDVEGKTVLKVQLTDNEYISPEGRRTGPLRGRIRLQPVRGYPKALQRIERLLRDELRIEPAVEESMIEAVRALGREPGDYSSKLDFHFDPTMGSEVVARRIQLHLLGVLETNIDGAKRDLDTEFLHDLRVACRRARSALSQIKGVFPEDRVAHFKERLAWVGRITGPTRDMDVYLLGFHGYRNTLPESVRADLDPLRDYLAAHHRSEQAKLAAELASPEFQTLLREWRAFLQEPPSVPSAPNAARPILGLASERIHKIYRRVLREGRAIGPGSPPADYHELRKNCKKLRYLMEFFQSLYPRRRIRRLIKAVKILLDNLGDYQDLEVQAEKLRAFGRDMLAEGDASADTLLAMGMLVDGLLRRQEQARKAFARRFSRFSRTANRRVFKELFSSGGGETV